MTKYKIKQYYNFRNRYYNPGAGRFMSEDPIGLGGDDTNFYRYVFNSSLLKIDPYGKSLTSFITSGAKNVANAANRLGGVIGAISSATGANLARGLSVGTAVVGSGITRVIGSATYYSSTVIEKVSYEAAYQVRLYGYCGAYKVLSKTKINTRYFIHRFNKLIDEAVEARDDGLF
ncbi:RHS repeat-associated core domain protein [Bacteriovorax sp. BAL6_X]|uniref:RHS repeat-associated core domain-containing protein n=1 Tax=Bacteriovorax sp. BAL6_X TaxID=1201290 RepID=UPI00038594C0|nr:RHS repeat-associated core domain-containing protein [Bacteriovorax sp. BAL6_X]EPZ51394.1 RHS repeat-associated core domain protein [Bacteriovorax sp. BAL6_X]